MFNIYCTPIGAAVAWGGQLVFDLLVFILTLWRTLVTYKLGHGNLVDIFFRDGEHSIFRVFIVSEISILSGCVYFGYVILNLLK